LQGVFVYQILHGPGIARWTAKQNTLAYVSSEPSPEILQ